VQRASICVAFQVALLVGTNLAGAEDIPKQPVPSKPVEGVKEKKPFVAVTISRETTYITQPLRKDGYVNYVAALNQRIGAGVTPANNAAVLFLKAMGPDQILPQFRAEYCRLLEIEPLPAKGDYYIPANICVKTVSNAARPVPPQGEEKEQDVYTTQVTPAMKRPWSRNVFPALVGWLAANEKPLALLVEASKRPRRYDPLIPENGCVISTLLPMLNQHREAARALTVRAMLRAGDGKPDEAWQDLLACHRLARLAGQGPTLIDALVAIALDGLACRGDQGLLQTPLTAAQIARMRADLDHLPPLPRMVDKIDVAERFMFLDSVAMVARDGFHHLGDLTGGKNDGFFESMFDAMARMAVDWDRVLRIGNFWYDRTAEACGKPTRTEREAALGKIDKDLRKLAAEAKDWRSQGLAMLGSPRSAVSGRIGNIFVSLLLPAVGKTVIAEDRATVQFDLTRLAFALAAYRADHGAYPARLAELAPHYVATIPNDLFNASDLHYRPEGSGFLLYSVGPNGKDDGGKGYDENSQGQGWDDITVRIASPAKWPKK